MRKFSVQYWFVPIFFSMQTTVNSAYSGQVSRNGMVPYIEANNEFHWLIGNSA